MAGSDPFIISKDADIEKASDGAINGALYQLWPELHSLETIYHSKEGSKQVY